MPSHRAAYTPWFGQPGMPRYQEHFHALPRPDALRFYEEFVARLPERVRQLESLVSSIAGFERWRAVDAPEMWLRLGEWLRDNVTLEEHVVQEPMAPRAPRPIRGQVAREHPSFTALELTAESASIGLDVGMFVARSLVEFCAPTALLCFDEDPRSHHEKMPIVATGSGKRRVCIFDPVYQGPVLSCSLAERRAPPDRLFYVVNQAKIGIARAAGVEPPAYYEPQE